MGKQKRRAKRMPPGRQRGILAVVSVLCLFAVLLVVALSQQGDLADRLRDAWERTVSTFGGAGQSPAAELVDMDAHTDALLVYAISTGNSDSLLVRAPGGESMLVDAADPDDIGAISATLDALGVQKLDAVVATHPDADHIGSMDDVIQRFSPEVLYMPDYEKHTKTYRDMMWALDRAETRQVLVTAPHEFMLGEVHVRVLNPQDAEYEDPNDTSVVLALTYGESSVLLTGDIETRALEDILEGYAQYLDVDVLKIAHHGSARSTTQELLDATTPALAIITAGADNDYGHPHRETVEILNENDITTLRTDQHGDIAIFVEKDSVDYKIAA